MKVSLLLPCHGSSGGFDLKRAHILPGVLVLSPVLELVVVFLPERWRVAPVAALVARWVLVWMVGPVPVVERDFATSRILILSHRRDNSEGCVERVVICALPAEDGGSEVCLC